MCKVKRKCQNCNSLFEIEEKWGDNPYCRKCYFALKGKNEDKIEMTKEDQIMMQMCFKLVMNKQSIAFAMEYPHEIERQTEALYSIIRELVAGTPRNP